MADSALAQTGGATVTVGTSAVGLSLPDTEYTGALIYVSAQPVRWRADGVAPTSTSGMFVAVGSYIDLTGHNYRAMLRTIQFIADTSATGSASLDVALFRGC